MASAATQGNAGLVISNIIDRARQEGVNVSEVKWGDTPPPLPRGEGAPARFQVKENGDSTCTCWIVHGKICARCIVRGMSAQELKDRLAFAGRMKVVVH